MSIVCDEKNIFKSISTKRVQLIHVLILLFSLSFFVNIGYSKEIDGYKDLKFRMTAKEAETTKVVKDGTVLFGQKRSVSYSTDKGKTFEIRSIDDGSDYRVKVFLDDKQVSPEYSVSIEIAHETAFWNKLAFSSKNDLRRTCSSTCALCS